MEKELKNAAAQAGAHDNAVSLAAGQIENLLLQQIERAERLAKSQPPKDFKSLGKITVGLCGGDGIGPVIMKEARRVLEILLKDQLSAGKIVFKEIEGLTIENRLAQGKAGVRRNLKRPDHHAKGREPGKRQRNLETRAGPVRQRPSGDRA